MSTVPLYKKDIKTLLMSKDRQFKTTHVQSFSVHGLIGYDLAQRIMCPFVYMAPYHEDDNFKKTNVLKMPCSKVLQNAFTAIEKASAVGKLNSDVAEFLAASKSATVFQRTKTIHYKTGNRVAQFAKDQEQVDVPECIFVGAALPYHQAKKLDETLPSRALEFINKRSGIKRHFGEVSEDFIADLPIARTIDGKFHIMLAGDLVANKQGRIVYELQVCTPEEADSLESGSEKPCFLTPHHFFFSDKDKNLRQNTGWPKEYERGYPKGPHTGQLLKLDKA